MYHRVMKSSHAGTRFYRVSTATGLKSSPVACYWTVASEILQASFRVKRCTQNDFVYGELDRVPMSIIHKIAMVIYWLKAVHGRKPNIVNAVDQNSLRNLGHNNKPGWTWHVGDILLSSGLGEAWYNQGVADENRFTVILKQWLHDIHQQDW